MNRTVVGVDIAKRVFQLHWVELGSGEIVSVQLKRAKFLEHFANRLPCLIGMEACGGSQHWARELHKLGHEVKLLSARMVKAFVSGKKNDAADARAIWTAVQQPGIKAVAVKSEGQQAVLALHRMRAQLVKFRTAQVNGLRGLLAEYGEVMPQAVPGSGAMCLGALERVAERLPAMVIETLREQYPRVGELDEQVQRIERRLQQWHRQDEASRRLAEIPGVGVLGATAALATIGDAKVFRSGREFAAWLGLKRRPSGRDKSPSDGRRTWRSWRSRTRWRARSGRCWHTSVSTNRFTQVDPRRVKQLHTSHLNGGKRGRHVEGLARLFTT
jgi:transposase